MRNKNNSKYDSDSKLETIIVNKDITFKVYLNFLELGKRFESN